MIGTENEPACCDAQYLCIAPHNLPAAMPEDSKKPVSPLRRKHLIALIFSVAPEFGTPLA
jgi:hypothetical protein